MPEPEPQETFSQTTTLMPGDDLPPSVASEANPPTVSSLPPSVGSEPEPEQPAEGVARSCCYTNKCFTKLPIELIEESRQAFKDMSRSDRSEALFQKVRGFCTNKDGEVITGKVNWSFKGFQCCRTFWECANYTSPATVDNYRKALKDGAVGPPEAVARVPTPSKQMAKADTYFLGMYQDLAEPYPTEDTCMDIKIEDHHELVEGPAHPLWDMAAILPGGPKENKYVPKRYLNPGTFQTLWNQYALETPIDDQVAQSTLYRTWRSTWRKFMPFRNIGQGKRCRICANLDESHRKANTDEEKRVILESKMKHIEEIKSDRLINVRGNAQSEHDCRCSAPDGNGKVLKITIDGMDQAKFRCPRNMVPQGQKGRRRRRCRRER